MMEHSHGLLLSVGSLANPWSSVLRSLSNPTVLIGDCHLDLALLQKQLGNNSS